jgi:CYTH domain-containing protein
MPFEIERKFIVDRLPDTVSSAPGHRIRQGYLAEEDDVEVRVRIVDRGASLTVKAGRGRSRIEVEHALSIDEAEELWPFTDGRRIDKVRRHVNVGAVATPGMHADVDVYDEPLLGLIVAEVEFDSDEAADAFVPPDWLGREVTGEQGWSNAALARFGQPGATTA